MNIFRLSISNMASRPLSTLLSLLLLVLSVGMISLFFQIDRQIQDQMVNNLRGVDMVVGAKGSPLQLTLSSIYHMDVPTGNIPLKEAEKLIKHRLVAYGIPLSYGDSYKGYRIVGTDHRYPDLYDATISNGRFWKKPMEVAVGAAAAQKLSLAPGDSFYGAHGLSAGGEAHEEHAYQVVGIFDYSNSVIDQLILTASESVWEVHHHGTKDETSTSHNQYEHDAHEAIEEGREITAMLVSFKNPIAMIQIPRMINESTNMQAAIPAYEISRLFQLMGMSIEVLNTIGLILLVVSGLSLFVSQYNALKDRRYELALMRTYGATRWQLVGLVMQEGMLMTVTGIFLGLLFSRTGLWLVSTLSEVHWYYSFSGWHWIDKEWWLVLMTFTLGLPASLLPAIRAFHLNISKTLANA